MLNDSDARRNSLLTRGCWLHGCITELVFAECKLLHCVACRLLSAVISATASGKQYLVNFLGTQVCRRFIAVRVNHPALFGKGVSLPAPWSHLLHVGYACRRSLSVDSSPAEPAEQQIALGKIQKQSVSRAFAGSAMHLVI